MTSSSLRLNPRRRTYVRLIGEIRHALNQALAEEHASRGLNRADMARAIGRDKSFVTRKLTGLSNMTLETLSDLAFALGRSVKIELAAKAQTSAGSNQAGYVFPPPTTSRPDGKPGCETLLATAA
jgi:transcriptional regulator with XRE-family HTH domain